MTIRRIAIVVYRSPRPCGCGAPSGDEVKGRRRCSVQRAGHEPSLGVLAAESAVNGGEHVYEPPPLDSIASKFVLDASNVMQFVATRAGCEHRPEDIRLLVQQCDLAMEFVMKVLRLAAISVKRRYSLASVRTTAHQTTLTPSVSVLRIN